MKQFISSLVLSGLVGIGRVVVAAPPRDLMMPPMQFDLYNIKTPQLIGIIAGCCVFAVTIAVVIYLLVASGTLQRALMELANDGLSASAKAAGSGNKNGTQNGSNGSFLSPYDEQPELYDHLLTARTKLPRTLSIDTPLKGEKVLLRSYQAEKDAKMLFEASNGSAQYHESAYDPGRVWGWCNLELLQPAPVQNNSSSVQSEEMVYGDVHPWESQKTFQLYFDAIHRQRQCSLFTIIDQEFAGKAIGMVVLSRNERENLSVNIENVWITPAFHGRKKAHEAVLLLLTHLFERGYRRVTAMIDERYVSARKFFMRCGFLYEATLRKHQIIRQRNCNTALYSFVNSDWVDGEGKLQRLCGWPKKKPAADEAAENTVPKTTTTTTAAAPAIAGAAASGGTTGAQEKKKKKKHKKTQQQLK